MKFRLLLLLASLVFVSACTKEKAAEPKIDALIVGKWFIVPELSNYVYTWEFYMFRDNGTMEIGTYNPSSDKPLSLSSLCYKPDPLQGSQGNLENGFHWVLLHEPGTTDGALRLMKYDEEYLTIIQYSSELHTVYRRISDWSETGYPEDIISQLPD